MGGRIDGDRDLHCLAVGVGCAGVGGDILVVDIDGTADEPVVGGNFTSAHITGTHVVAVVHDGL